MNDSEYLSASQLKKWRRCPEEYRFRYKSDRQPTKAEKGYRSMGSAVHETIETTLEENPELRQESKLNWIFESELEDLDYDYPEEMHDTVLTCLSNAARYISMRKDIEFRGVEVDHTFRVNRPDISADFRAIMDVTTKGRDEIWDWKTGNVREEEDHIQAAVYLAAFANKYGTVPEVIRFIYLKDREVNSIKRTDENGTEFWSEEERPDGWEEVIRLAKEVLRAWEDDEWPADPAPNKCYFCDYSYFCSAAPTGMGNVSWEKYGQ